MPQQKRAKKDRSYSHEPRVYAPDQNNIMLQIQSMIKLLTSLRTAYAEELNLKKDVTSYDDLLDSLRLSLKGCHKKNKIVKQAVKKMWGV